MEVAMVHSHVFNPQVALVREAALLVVPVITLAPLAMGAVMGKALVKMFHRLVPEAALRDTLVPKQHLSGTVWHPVHTRLLAKMKVSFIPMRTYAVSLKPEPEPEPELAATESPIL